jgi:hypothetical protein
MSDKMVMNDTMLHFTGRNKDDQQAFSALESICKSEELWLSFCPIFSKEEWQKEIAMACFSDILVSEAKSHSEAFGKFAIGFNKHRLIRYGANPVFYTTSKHYNKIKCQLALLDRMKDLEKDREWKECTEPFHFTEDETFSLLIVSGLLQEYSYKQNDNKLNYSQREWRITFNSLPFAGQNKKLCPGMSSFTKEDGKSVRILKLHPEDIEFIVIPKSFEESGKELAKSISKPYKIFEIETA